MELLSGQVRSRRGLNAALGFLLLAACLSQSGCVTAPSGARQYQDETTAVTITIASEPFVLAREVSMLAVNARDYVSLYPLEVNRAGQRRYYFFGYSWSTIDRRDDKGAAASVDAELNLQADDRAVALRMSPSEFQSAGVSALPMTRPVPDARPLLYPTDRATLLFVGTARALSAQFGGPASAAALEQYRQWTRPGSGFEGFFERIGPAQVFRAPSRQ
ncbi:MAG: hypothetical protein ABL964_13995 [Steroidobacteraceae bacterium]